METTSNANYLKVARNIAKKSGELLVERLPSELNLAVRQRRILMESADREVHDYMYNELKLHYPSHSFISVFSKNQKFHKDRPQWVIDPIVGLANFGHGDPGFALSIAFVENGITELAVVYSPIFEQLFTAIKGGGTYLNGQKIQVSRTGELQDSLLSTRFPYDIRTSNVTNLEIFAELILKAESVRNNATASLDLAYVASGQYDGFWAINMNPWDLVAAALLVEEAGGKVTGLSGEPYQMEFGNILATNGVIHNEVVKAITEAKSKYEIENQTSKRTTI